MSIFTDLCNTLDKRSLAGIAGSLGESETSVSRGMQTSIGTVLGGMAANSESPGFLRRILDLLPEGSRDLSWANVATAAGGGASPLMSAGARMLPALFGSSESAITRTLGTETGLAPGLASSLLTMAAPMVMSYFSRRLHGGGMTMDGLGSLLQRETPAIRAALPASLVGLLWPHERETVAANPVIHQTVTPERPAGRWVLPLILLALIPGLLWLFSHGRRANIATTPPVSTGAANRIAPEPVPTPRQALRVDLYFDTGSSKLRPDSQARLDELAGAVRGTPDARVAVNGYTDNVGNHDSNVQLSQARANTVASDLERRGISANIVNSNGFAEENPIADNNTAQGRAMNRRVSVQIEGH